MTPYPTEEQLLKIQEYPGYDWELLMVHVEVLWEYADWGWHRKGRTYRISTGGWSGNEDIIQALQANVMFWSLCWVQSRRGGHYIFEIPKKAVKDVTKDFPFPHYGVKDVKP